MSVGQTYEMKVPPSVEKKEALLKKLKDQFAVAPELNFTVSTYDLTKEFDSIPKNTVYDDAYLKAAEDSLAVSPNNPIFLNQVAAYCQYHGLDDMAVTYFKKTLEKLKVSYFDNEAAMLGFRGTLKLNIDPSDTTAIADYKRAFELEPTDSSYLDLYVFGLMSHGKVDDVKSIVYETLNRDKIPHAFPFIYLYYTDIIYPVMELNQLMYTDSVEFDKAAYRKKHYWETIDMSNIEKLTDKHVKVENVTSFRKLYETSMVLIKVLFFESDENFLPIMDYSKKEQKDMLDLIAHFKKLQEDKQLNEFTINKTLGILNLLIQEYQMAESHLIRAIKSFQEDRISINFSPNESYMALISLYHVTGQKEKFIEATKSAIKNKPLGKPYHNYDNMLAIHYLKENKLNEAYGVTKNAVEYPNKDFESLRLHSFLNYLLGYTSLAEKYLVEAGNYTMSYDQQYAIYIQAALYHLDIGNAREAYDNIVLAKESQNGDCELCDELVETYISIKE